MRRNLSVSLTLKFSVLIFGVQAGLASAETTLRDAEAYYQSGQYYRAARAAFTAESAKSGEDFLMSGHAYAWVTLSLIKSGLYQASSYFFIRTLQKGEKASIRRVLTETENLLLQVGPDILRKYLIRHTRYEDYDTKNRSAYLFSLAKEALLIGQTEKAIGYISGIPSNSPLWPYALQLRGTAQAIQGKTREAIEDFKLCTERSGLWTKVKEAEDLANRCIASHARTLYQMDQFDEAERVYDTIPKKSLVWPDVLFEQAWTGYAKGEYNRALGKLVSYKSPALSFVFNSEAEVLTAQSYLMLCLYPDANRVIDQFNQKYTRLGEEVKTFVETTGSNLAVFFDFGKDALKAPLYTSNVRYRMANRFVRGPYFRSLVTTEKDLQNELSAIRQFEVNSAGGNPTAGFAGFLEQVLKWRVKSIRLMGGAFVKNSLMDYHAALVSDFEKMSFIKIELLRRAKEKLMNLSSNVSRERGNVEPGRKGYQYYWSFNGEFWNDELGDYVFGLESQCHKGGEAEDAT